jgi:1,6-anhydro-N-acetylmuramate kinase
MHSDATSEPDAMNPDDGTLIAGCMTGTSLDGLDVALVRIRGAGLAMRCELVRHSATPLGLLAEPMRRIAKGGATTAEALCGLSHALSALHAGSLAALIGDDACSFAVVHGQTLWHRPPMSLQLLTPAVIAARLGVPVVSDLRAGDLALGGEGAPITPLADAVLFGSGDEDRAIVNLGGFINVTLLPAGSAGHAGYSERIEGFDVCACNQLLDAVARAALGAAYDAGGEAALAADADTGLVDRLMRMLASESPGDGGRPRSLGSADEPDALVEGLLRENIGGPVLARSACVAIARTLAGRVGHSRRLVLAGGGALNAALVEAIASSCGRRPLLADDFGVPIGAREAMCMAVLGAIAAGDHAMTLPRVTGRRDRTGDWRHVTGTWTGGRVDWR